MAKRNPMTSHGLPMLIALAAVTACHDLPISKQGNAYEQQRFICTSERQSEWRDRVSDCNGDDFATNGCAGIISMEGELEGVPIRLTSTLSAAVFELRRPPEIGDHADNAETSTARYLDRIDLVGTGPYFLFTLKLKSIGGRAGDASDHGGEAVDDFGRFLFLSDAPSLYGDSRSIGDMLDDRVRGDLRISNGRENRDLAALEPDEQPASGNPITDSNVRGLRLFEANANLVSGLFAAEFGEPGALVRGCFWARPTRTTVSDLSVAIGDDTESGAAP